MSRGGFKVSRNGTYDYSAGERVSWLDELASNIEKASKNAVEVARHRSQQSLVDQISSIMHGSQSHGTVESVVQDMQERVGLTAYLNRLEADTDETAKFAQEGVPKQDIFSTLDSQLANDVLVFITNKIATHRGRIHLPAVQEDVLATFKNKGIKPEDINNADVAKYISDAIASELDKQPALDMPSGDLGRGVGVEDVEADPANTDFFHGLLPEMDQ
jgi:hypothetical protein